MLNKQPVNQLKLESGRKAGFTLDGVVLHSGDCLAITARLLNSDSENHQGFSFSIQMERETHWNATIAPHNTNTRFSGCIHRLCLNEGKPVGEPQQLLTSALCLPLIFISPIQLILQEMMALSFIIWGTECHKLEESRLFFI